MMVKNNMSGHNLRIWASIQAELVKVESMKADNLLSQLREDATRIHTWEFLTAANVIEDLAKQIEP